MSQSEATTTVKSTKWISLLSKNKENYSSRTCPEQQCSELGEYVIHILDCYISKEINCAHEDNCECYKCMH